MGNLNLESMYEAMAETPIEGEKLWTLDLYNDARANLGLPRAVGFTRKGRPVFEVSGGADTPSYRDLRIQSHIIVDEASVTLGTTQKALWATAITVLPANYFWPGKTCKLTAFGKATTDGTAGNYVFGMAAGVGDAPAGIVNGATSAGTVSQTNISWIAQGYIECRTRGATGTIRMWGLWQPAVAIFASTLQPYTFPASAPADTTLDTTLSTTSVNYQLQRSGAGVWTALTTNILYEALN